ncbi:ABC transporter-like protein [Tepidicaulis marinus]|uniref:ABC transporter-like protein n=1 Tax=Tepidicaulis marinus TaxID=1333998 RepID=A0A081BAS0_9HYPH|nr:ABC transporter ATP-binding protein [Tepidicaulis marinus]GAK45138.1 ABC transporter-like protein [Tepidicaulis marinus]
MTKAGLLQIEGAGKTYRGGTQALSGIDLEIGRGEFVSLVGPSGCGKSTLLRLMAGLLSPSAGTLSWAGGARPEAGFVFQDATLMPWADVFSNVHLPLKLKGISAEDARARIMAALSRVGLGEAAHAMPRALSGGMRMRVSITRALVMEPTVLFMDEPFAALDELTREKLDDDLLTLWNEQGWTVIFVTHSVYEAVYLSERVLIMNETGRLEADMPIEGGFPRGQAFRDSQLFFEQVKKVSAALRGRSAP